MRVYLEIIKNMFKSNFMYRFNFIVSIFTSIIVFFIQYNIWRAIYSDASIIASSVGNINLNEMVTYLVISTCISIIINTNILGSIGGSIQSGQIAMELVKPLNYNYYLFFNSLGDCLFRFLFQMLPSLAILLLFFNIALPTLTNLCFFLVALIFSYFINYLLRYLLGSLAYWYMSVWHFDLLIAEIISIFAGAYIPIWFFPKALLHLSEVLPFQLIYYFPLSVYLGKYQLQDILYYFMLQMVWIVVLFVLSSLLYKRGMKKLVIQGG